MPPHLRKLSRDAGLGELDADTPAFSRAIGTAIYATLRRDPYDTPHFSRSVVVPQRSGRGSYTLQFSALGHQTSLAAGTAAMPPSFSSPMARRNRRSTRPCYTAPMA